MQLSKPSGNYDSDDSLNHFLTTVADSGIELYDHQEEAILEIFSDNNVILNTPTGSGKSMVALAHHYKSFCAGRTSYYTVPIKALANEKFLSLCQSFGPENVGMVTGDATVNPAAPIICCTAEILSNIALRDGERAKVDDVIIDEFHYYSDEERGVAWQIPLLTLSQARFTLMSATIGDTHFFQKELSKLTGAPTTLVQSDQRPVPLEFDYSEIPLAEKVTELVESNKAPVYLVHFSQRAAAESSQNLLSHNYCSKTEKQEISEALNAANFQSPYGKEMSKLLRHGIGIHHAGLLPKYRILVEKLTQRGLLKVICGTDTLGVGVNVPIRSVLFTQLCKFDGSAVKILTVRDFKQIAGRAGRRGFDDKGYVVAQAPEHVIENLRLEAKAATSSKKKKFVKKKPPEHGFVNWNQDTFEKLEASAPEALKSSFRLRHNLILNLLSRRHEDGCAALKQLLTNCHETEASKKKLRSQARKMFIALVRGGVLTILPPSQRSSKPNTPKVQLHLDLQEDFTMNQALGLYLLEAIPELDRSHPNYALQVLSLIESILEDPATLLKAQINKAKGDLIAELRNEGVSYEERMERLEEVTYPQPGKDWIYDTFNRFRAKHPWVQSEGIRPKSIAREMFEEYMDFEDYIKDYKLERSEAILLRHLSEVYKVLAQTVPPNLKDETLLEAEAYLKDHVTSVDSSLIDEWELMRNPKYLEQKQAKQQERAAQPLTQNKKKFTKLVRQKSLDALKFLAFDDIDAFLSQFSPESPDGSPWSFNRIDPHIDAYFENHHSIRLDPAARNLSNTIIRESSDTHTWQVTQILCDPDEKNDWAFVFNVDLNASNIQKTPIIQLEKLTSIS
ncbi:DEAD/DEAH box helicase [Rubritalea tangerina]|uniref:DEAD/DEAH box helicase n=2 Tax=Rubritalea tangerina TaxID=430798 RepID=A0ABW4ZD23_9BACT